MTFNHLPGMVLTGVMANSMRGWKIYYIGEGGGGFLINYAEK